MKKKISYGNKMNPNYFWFIEYSSRQNAIKEESRSYVIGLKKTPSYSKEIKIGDHIAFIEKGYGIYRYSEVIATNLLDIKNMQEWNNLRNNLDPFLSDKYLTKKTKEIGSIIKENKVIKVFLCQHKPLELNKHFAVKFTKSLQGSIIKFENSGISITDLDPIEAAIKDINEYTKIPGFIRYKLSRVMGTIIRDKEDCDHIIPKSVGGPGIFLENIVPIEKGANRAKSNRIDRKLIDVAKEWNDKGIIDVTIPSKLHDEWDSSAKSDSKFQQQKNIAQEITSKIKKLIPSEKQRLFYWQIRERIYHNVDFKKLYKNADEDLSFIS